ncbi:MAG: FliM/FliN family flagellar motor switch protein [Gemmobacter sp.]
MTTIRRKIGTGRAAAVEGAVTAASVWPVALARGARGRVALDLAVTRLTDTRASLAEVLEVQPERALIAVLEGPGEGLGVLSLSPEVLAGMIERQTLGRVTDMAPLPRRPTRTDAAMVAGLVDAALEALDAGLVQAADRTWASGFRYASHLDEARPLGLMLEDAGYRMLRAEVALEGGAKTGVVLLVLPAEGQAAPPAPPSEAADAIAAMLVFQAAMAEQVQGSEARLDAVIARVTLPLSLAMALGVGEVIRLGIAAVDRIDLEGIDGVRMAGGRLGQNRGMRALRLSEDAMPAAKGPVGVVPGLATVEAALRRTG